MIIIVGVLVTLHCAFGFLDVIGRSANRSRCVGKAIDTPGVLRNDEVKRHCIASAFVITRVDFHLLELLAGLEGFRFFRRYPLQASSLGVETEVQPDFI